MEYHAEKIAEYEASQGITTIVPATMTLSEDEVEFVAKTMTSLFLSKSNFNIYNLPNAYEMLEEMDTHDILKCMQIANKETASLYKDFSINAQKLNNIQPVFAYNFEGKRYDVGEKLGFILTTIEFALQNNELASEVRKMLERIQDESAKSLISEGLR